MQNRKLLIKFLAYTILIGCISFPVSATRSTISTSNFNVIVEPLKTWNTEQLDASVMELAPIESKATNSVDITVKAGSIVYADESFSMEVGETITISCLYSPTYASVDFGLLAPDGSFYYQNATDGNIDETVQISKQGKYTFVMRNNSSVDVRVVGFINY